MTNASLNDRPTLGLIAFFLAALALVAVTLHVSGIIDPPKQSAAQTIGQIAAEIRDSAQRAISGQEPAPPPEPAWDIALVLAIGVPILAGLATVLAGISLYRSEPPTLPKIAIAMGIGAFVMQFVFWLAVLICAFVLLVAILRNIEGILPG